MKQGDAYQLTLCRQERFLMVDITRLLYTIGQCGNAPTAHLVVTQPVPGLGIELAVIHLVVVLGENSFFP